MTTATNKPRPSPEPPKVAPPAEKLVRMYRQMVAIRLFEERVNDLYTRALMPGLAHLYIGEEAIAVGVCEALRRTTTSRARTAATGTVWPRARTPELMFAELLGKEAGYCKGKGGSMHIADPATGNLGANAIVGGSAGIATGAAFSSKYLKNGPGGGVLLRRGRARTGPALRGDEPRAALEAAGHLRRARTTATTSTRTSRSPRRARSAPAPARSAWPTRRWTARTSATSTPWRRSTSSGRATGDGPAFLQFKTYRYHGHHVGDIARAYYRPKAEEEEWVTSGIPITLHGEWLMANGVADRAALDADSGRVAHGDGCRGGVRGRRLVSRTRQGDQDIYA